MNSLLANLLAIHVLVAVTGVFLFGGVTMELLRKNISLKKLQIFSLLGLLAYLTSWVTGGYYYVTHYGPNVKPIIKGGNSPWVHAILMEVKEHIFLFLPFLAMVTVLAIFFGGKNLTENPSLKRSVAFVAFLTFFIGVAVALMGVVISGAAVI